MVYVTIFHKGETMPVKESQRKASIKYINEKTDEIKVRVPKGKKEVIKAYADELSESVNAFINRAIDEAIEVQKKEDNN